MKINSIKIHAIGGIKDLKLNFKEGLNLICGPNGIGKTTILNCLSQPFSYYQIDTLRRNVNFDFGKYSLELSAENNIIQSEFTRTNYFPTDSMNTNTVGNLNRFSNELLAFKPVRDIPFNIVTSINKDPARNDGNCGQCVSLGLNANDFKSWFINRYLWSAHKNGITSEQRHNLETSQKVFEMIDKDISFSKIDGSTFDIFVNTPRGEIYYEYLSSGYKSNLCLIFGIIKEIEYRFKNPTIKIEDFDGIILIDELDLHLHPQWQGVIITTLKELFPKAQIIATTHSPSMIQAAKQNEIIPLGFDDDNQVCLRDIPNSKYGYQGWTIEEILTDVMGLEDTRSELYKKILKEFDTALDNENITKAKEASNKLIKMLHPKNPLRKIIQLQLASIGGE